MILDFWTFGLFAPYHIYLGVSGLARIDKTMEASDTPFSQGVRIALANELHYYQMNMVNRYLTNTQSEYWYAYIGELGSQFRVNPLPLRHFVNIFLLCVEEVPLTPRDLEIKKQELSAQYGRVKPKHPTKGIFNFTKEWQA
jgi:hypothetical protein